MDVMQLRRAVMAAGMGKVKTVTGSLITVNDALARNAKSLIVNFSPVQASGTPAPDNVLPISGWTGVTGYRTGKNLIDPATKTISSTVARWYHTDGFLLKSGKTYTFTTDISGTVYIMPNRQRLRWHKPTT